MTKTNKIHKIAPLALSAGIVFVVLMTFSIVAAFASVSSDTQTENNLFAGLPNQVSSLSVANQGQDTYKITNSNLNTDDSNIGDVVKVQFDVFKTEYLSDDEALFAKSSNKDNIVAPGTGNIKEKESKFTIENTSDSPVEVKCDFFCDGKPDPIPIKFKMIDPDGKYLVGSSSSYEDSKKINNVTQTRTVPVGGSETYYFPWYWEFEGDNNYDTYLGNKTVSVPVTITLGIKDNKPVPVPDPVPDPVPGPNENNESFWASQTGDFIKIGLAVGIAVAIVCATAFIVYKRGKREH